MEEFSVYSEPKCMIYMCLHENCVLDLNENNIRSEKGCIGIWIGIQIKQSNCNLVQRTWLVFVQKGLCYGKLRARIMTRVLSMLRDRAFERVIVILSCLPSIMRSFPLCSSTSTPSYIIENCHISSGYLYERNLLIWSTRYIYSNRCNIY